MATSSEPSSSDRLSGALSRVWPFQPPFPLRVSPCEPALMLYSPPDPGFSSLSHPLPLPRLSLRCCLTMSATTVIRAKDLFRVRRLTQSRTSLCTFIASGMALDLNSGEMSADQDRVRALASLAISGPIRLRHLPHHLRIGLIVGMHLVMVGL
jgi:hypothetical protein